MGEVDRRAVERGEKDCSELGAGVGTEPGPVDVLVELTELQDFFIYFFSVVSPEPAYVLMPSCFTHSVKQSPVNQSQTHHV